MKHSIVDIESIMDCILCLRDDIDVEGLRSSEECHRLTNQFANGSISDEEWQKEFRKLMDYYHIDKDELIKEMVDDDEIVEFDSLEEMKDYFNTYDYQDFKTVDDLLEYDKEYIFKYNNKYYHINHDEVKNSLERYGLFPGQKIVKGE